MFVGAIESEFRRWFVLNKAAFDGRTLHVGCSGNFTVEQLVGPSAKAVHSNDVSIYTHFLGHYLAGHRFEWRLKRAEDAWLQPYFERNSGAAIVLLLELLKWDPTKNAYNRRFHDCIRDDWERMFAETALRVEQARGLCRLTSFRSSDIWDFVDEAHTLDPDGVFVAFLPFYKGGYEKLYRKLDEMLDWSRPRYEVIDAERKRMLIEKIKQFDHVFIDDVEYQGEPAVMLKRKTATKQMWLYSNLDLKRVLVRNHTRERATHYPQLDVESLSAITPESVVTIKRVQSAEINYYRNRYLAKSIEFVDGMWSFLFFIDGRLFGFAITSLSKFGVNNLYILSDFVLPGFDKDRLSKLLLLVLQSTHFRELCEEMLMRRVPELMTTAFTDKPVSMKYRGVFQLGKRGEQPSGKKFLNYSTATGLHSDREAIEKWMQFRKSSKR